MQLFNRVQPGLFLSFPRGLDKTLFSVRFERCGSDAC